MGLAALHRYAAIGLVRPTPFLSGSSPLRRANTAHGHIATHFGSRTVVFVVVACAFAMAWISHLEPVVQAGLRAEAPFIAKRRPGTLKYGPRTVDYQQGKKLSAGGLESEIMLHNFLSPGAVFGSGGT